MYIKQMQRQVPIAVRPAGAAQVCPPPVGSFLPSHEAAAAAQFNSPVEVNWEYMDTGLMRRFWANHEDERASKADISDRVLVFHRGISTVRFCGVQPTLRSLQPLDNRDASVPVIPASNPCDPLQQRLRGLQDCSLS